MQLFECLNAKVKDSDGAFLQVLEYKAKNKRTKETLLTCLADLFYSIVTQKRKVGLYHVVVLV